MVMASIQTTQYGLENMSSEDVNRVMRSVIPRPGGCLESTYTASTPGGPQIQWRVDGEVHFMYHWRIMYYIYSGEVPKRFTVFRTCRNHKCVNPDHRKARG